ncbi:Na+/H+ antiporter NhaA [Xinfangfangia sp. CPCC 101601]|uniref:Putative Na(+)/H(+) antiporter NhaA homolog n=1 Tax=Pseudogemmobacter lacusdianii TaxID=3069608 RepID=A0ABU0VUS6_9RHOB|nr:Na+/H+ antiporter NhaA [Xinfangfangia sp. CPCC 101601]MDQ2065476.1 Na+/H+ antiporter NhaA [Xinfangfangia sp. CPCC 101601]
MYRISRFVGLLGLALLMGILVATTWVNLHPASYYDFIEWHLAQFALPQWIWRGTVSITPFMVVADMLMAFFFFFIAKELWESLVLERGALAGRGAVFPLGLSLGGMIGAGTVWLVLQAAIETAEEASFGQGWTVPLGSDLVLAYLVGRRLFAPGDPALQLLLLLGITTDILALLVLGLSNPNLSLRLLWLALPLLASLTVWALYGRAAGPKASERQKRAGQALWPYLIAGALSWFGTAASGMPAALGLLPVIPAIAHANRSFGLFAEAEDLLHDPLNRLVQLLAWPLVAVLFLFGLIRGGIDLQAFAPTTWVTLGAMWIGRPLGMLLAGLVLIRAFGLRLPETITLGDLGRIALVLAMGFTVPAIAISSSLPGGAMQEAARLGLALSLLAGALAAALPRAAPPPPGPANHWRG